MDKEVKPYIFPTSILIIGILATWFTFWQINWVANQSKALTLSISSLSIIFGLFQIFLNRANQKIRDKNKLRHEEYRNINQILSKISELLNENMTDDVKVYSLVTSLMNQINRFLNFNKINDEYLFEGIQSNPKAKEVKSELDEILYRTDKFRKELEDLENENREVHGFQKEILKMNWHNDIREKLKTFNTIKYDYLKQLQQYFN